MLLQQGGLNSYGSPYEEYQKISLWNTGGFDKWTMTKKVPGCWGHEIYEILPSYLGIMINHYKDPY